MKTKLFLYSGLTAPIMFWATTIVCGSMVEGYSHLKWLVSELGTLGSRTQNIFTIGLVLSAFLNMFFVIGLWQCCKKLNLNKIPIVFLSLYSFIAGPALYPMPLKLHEITGIPFPFLMLSPVFALIFWRKKEHILKTKAIAIISFSVMIFGFLIYFPNILHEYFGLKQRFLYIGWTIWSLFLSYRYLKLLNCNEKT